MVCFFHSLLIIFTGRTPLDYAAFMGQEHVIDKLLSKKVSEIDHIDVVGRTPLLAAASNGHTGLCDVHILATLNLPQEQWTF